MKKRIKLWLAILCSAFIMIGAVKAAGHFLASPAQTPVKADTIVALGGDSGERVCMAQSLFAGGYAPQILLTGTEVRNSRTRPTYRDWRATYLKKHGVPVNSILYDARSLNSWQEAVNTLQLMKQRGWKQVIVVSDPPHMRRLHWVWSKVFRGSGLEYSLCASQPSWWNERHWWSNKISTKFVVDEYLKLVYYVIKYS